MSREIKFRGTSLKTNDFVFGDMYYNNGNCFVCSEDHSDGVDTYYNDMVDPESVGQFTGLKDKNGVDIYEGDVLKLISSGFQTPSYNGKVFIRTVSFCEGSFITIQKHENGISDEINYLSASTHFEVIGNIHQNPELIATLNN